MKSRFFIISLLTMLLVPTFTACGLLTLDNRLDAIEDTVENRIDAAEDAAENAAQKNNSQLTPTPQQNPATTITSAEAESIALQHAGFSADDVNYLHTEYDFDDGIARYEVQFHQGYLEYDYDIHAESGAILSFDIDD